MAKTLKEQNQALREQVRTLTIKLRGSIAQANRYFERMKILETERNMLIAALKEHGVDMQPQVSKLGALRERFLELASEHSMANVRIIRGHIEIRQDGAWVETQ